MFCFEIKIKDVYNEGLNDIWKILILVIFFSVVGGFIGGFEKYKIKVVIDSNGIVMWFVVI